MAKIIAKELRNMKSPDFSFFVQLISQAGRREAMLVVVGKWEQISRSERVAPVLGVDTTQQPRVRSNREWGLPVPHLWSESNLNPELVCEYACEQKHPSRATVESVGKAHPGRAGWKSPPRAFHRVLVHRRPSSRCVLMRWRQGVPWGGLFCKDTNSPLWWLILLT